MRIASPTRKTAIPISLKLHRVTVAELQTIREKSDLEPAIREMIAHKGPYLLDVQVPYQEHVLPMIPGGMTVDDMILE